MAYRAVVIKRAREMIRVLHAIIVFFVTRPALFGRTGVNIVDMALCAANALVFSRQCKVCGVVIKSRRSPGGLGVAGGAIARIASGSMVGIRDSGIVRFMTAKTVPRQAG